MPVRSYGVTSDGAKFNLPTLDNAAGPRVHIITYGGTIEGIEAPDREGSGTNVSHTLPSLADYVGQNGYPGELIGRFARSTGGTRPCASRPDTSRIRRTTKAFARRHCVQASLSRAPLSTASVSVRAAVPLASLCGCIRSCDDGSGLTRNGSKRIPSGD